MSAQSTRRKARPRIRRQLQLVLVLAVFALTLGLTLIFSAQDGLGKYPLQRMHDWNIWKLKTTPDKSAFLYEPATDDTCQGFDPSLPFEQDPPDCHRAKQYRQVQRVLEREKSGDHEHWEFMRPSNIATLEKLLKCFTTFPSPCPPRPLIISGWWYTAMGNGRGVSGEAIWQKGLIQFIEKLGLGIITAGPYTNWITTAEMMPDVYRVVWSSDVEAVSCLTDPRCVAQYTPPIDAEDLSVGVPPSERGTIPIWAITAIDYWGAKPLEISNNDHYWGLTERGDWSFHPLGQQWIATPWPLPGHVHLPYSIEEYCLPLAVKAHDEREESVLILAKRSSYFDTKHISPRSFWTNLSTTYHLLTTAEIEQDHPLPDGLSSLGIQSRTDYEVLVGSVQALLGIGVPAISPSVYTALCQATPVIVAQFREEAPIDGWELYSGNFQHGPAQMIGPPYVYSYFSQNYTQMAEAVHQAINTPIDRYIPPEMRFAFGLEQMRNYLDRDAKEMYRQVLMENGGQVPRLKKGARERCYELKRCSKMFEAGRVPSSPPGYILDESVVEGWNS